MKITDHIYLVASGSKWGFGLTNELDCNVYLIDTGDGCIMIDAGTGLEPERMDAIIESHGFSLKDIKALILTHYHGDHAVGGSRIQKISGCDIYAPELEAKAIEEGDETATSVGPSKGGIYPKDYVYEPSDHVIGLKEGDSVTVGDVTLTAHMCPGHSLQDMVLFGKIDGMNCLFAGDCVFAHGQVLLQSLYDVSIYPYAQAMRKIAELPIEAIFPGHGTFCLENGIQYVNDAVKAFDSGLIPQQLFYFT